MHLLYIPKYIFAIFPLLFNLLLLYILFYLTKHFGHYITLNQFQWLFNVKLTISPSIILLHNLIIKRLEIPRIQNMTQFIRLLKLIQRNNLGLRFFCSFHSNYRFLSLLPVVHFIILNFYRKIHLSLSKKRTKYIFLLGLKIDKNPLLLIKLVVKQFKITPRRILLHPDKKFHLLLLLLLQYENVYRHAKHLLELYLQTNEIKLIHLNIMHLFIIYLVFLLIPHILKSLDILTIEFLLFQVPLLVKIRVKLLSYKIVYLV